MTKYLLSLWFVLLASTVSAQEPVPVHIFTKTDSSGFVDVDQKARLQNVKGAINFLRQSLRAKLVTVVDTPEAATILVEVTTEGTQEDHDSLAAFSNSMNQLQGGLATLRPLQPETKNVKYRYATLRVGTYATEIKGAATGDGASLGKAVADWITLNRATLQKKD